MLVVAGSNFLSTALLLKLLGSTRFAAWAQVEPLILLALPLAGFGIQIGLLNQIARDPQAPQALLPFHLGASVLVASVVALVMVVSATPSWAVLAGLIVLLEGGIVFFISYWRATNRPVTYAAVEGGRAASVMLALAAMTVLPALALAEVGEYLALRAGLGAIFLGLAFGLTRWRWTPDADAARRAVRYGLPIVIASAAVTMIMNFDRYAVSWVAGPETLAAYVAQVKTTQILSSAVAPFFTWFAPLAIARLQRGDQDDGMFGRAFFAFAAVDTALALGLWLVAPALWPHLFAAVTYDPAIMAVLVVGVAVFAAGNPLSLGSLSEGRTHHALYVTLTAGAIGLLVVLVLAPVLGPLGVAIGKAVGLGAYTVIFALHTWRHLRIRYPWGKVAALVLLALLIGAGAVEPISRFSPWAAILAASAASILVVIVAWALDRVSFQESGR
jgi:O-antigen/teichoic acid export membrane protein